MLIESSQSRIASDLLALAVVARELSPNRRPRPSAENTVAAAEAAATGPLPLKRIASRRTLTEGPRPELALQVREEVFDTLRVS